MPGELDVGIGPRLLAIETAVRALVDHASQADPALRGRITAAAEAYLATIPHASELERAFADRARACVASITRPPAG